jgi:hypothetical protein
MWGIKTRKIYRRRVVRSQRRAMSLAHNPTIARSMSIATVLTFAAEGCMLGLMAACWVLMDRASGVTMLEGVAAAAMIAVAVTPSTGPASIGWYGAFALLATLAILPALHTVYRYVRRLPHGSSALVVASFAAANALALLFSYLVDDRAIAVSMFGGSQRGRIAAAGMIVLCGGAAAIVADQVMRRSALSAILEFARDDGAYLQSFAIRGNMVALVATVLALVGVFLCTVGFVAVQDRFGILNYGRFLLPSFAIALAQPFFSPLRSLAIGVIYVALVRTLSGLGSEALERAYQGAAFVAIVSIQVAGQATSSRRLPKTLRLPWSN